MYYFLGACPEVFIPLMAQQFANPQVVYFYLLKNTFYLSEYFYSLIITCTK